MSSRDTVHQGSPADTEGRERRFVLDHVLPAMPTRGNEFLWLLERPVHCIE